MEDSAGNDAGIEDPSMQTNPTQVSSAKECVFFVHLWGCTFGQKCRFNHSYAKVGQKGSNQNAPANNTRKTPCKLYPVGKCKYGVYCKYNHVKPNMPDPQQQYNFFGLPLRPGEPECSYFMRTGTCKYGPGCKFNHPERPINPQAYGSYVYGDAGENQYQYSGYSTQFQDSSYHNMEQTYGWNGNEGTPICLNYERTGVCAYRSSCPYDHPPKWAPNPEEASTSQSALVVIKSWMPKSEE